MVEIQDYTSPSGGQAFIFGESLAEHRGASSNETSPARLVQTVQCVLIPTNPLKRKRNLATFRQEETSVARVVAENASHDNVTDDVRYTVRFEDGRVANIGLSSLIGFTNGQEALDAFKNDPDQEDDYEQQALGEEEVEAKQSQAQLLPQDDQPPIALFKRAVIRWPSPGQPDPLFAYMQEATNAEEREERERAHSMK